MSHLRPWHRKLRYRVVMVVAIMVLLATSLAAWLSHRYWGYVFSPRAMDSRIERIDRVTAYAEASVVGKDLTRNQRYVPPTVQPRSSSPSMLREPYYIPLDRVQESLENRGLLSQRLPLVSGQVVGSIPQLMRDAGVVVEDYGGYSHLLDTRVQASIIEATTSDGEQLLIVIYSGGEVANDHLAHYELVFDRSTQPMRLLSSRQWYFDVAGIEGTTFYHIAGAMVIISQILTLPVLAVIVYLRRFARSAHMRRGLCPMCKHDLRADFGGGCNECGWRKNPASMQPADIAFYTPYHALLRRIARPRAVLSAIALLITVAAVWWAHSLPGGIPLLREWTPPLLIIAMLFLAIKLAAALWNNRFKHSARANVWLAALLLIGGLTLAGLPGRWPLHVRFRLSEAALNERIERAALMPGWVGLYRVQHVVATPDNASGTIVVVGEAYPGQTEEAGFVHYPSASARERSTRTDRLVLRPLHSNWYLIEQRLAR